MEEGYQPQHRIVALNSSGFQHHHSGQISIIPKPELRGFWGSSLIKQPFRVTSADVVIICPDHYLLKYLESMHITVPSFFFNGCGGGCDRSHHMHNILATTTPRFYPKNKQIHLKICVVPTFLCKLAFVELHKHHFNNFQILMHGTYHLLNLPRIIM